MKHAFYVYAVLFLVAATMSLTACCDDNPQQGATGSQGPIGPTGPQGNVGQPGTNGVDPTPVTAVQFCSGTTTYPGTFVELGLCINDNLYAVYSANNGFLVLLVPGAYTSNAIGSSCNFTVAAHCQVSR